MLSFMEHAKLYAPYHKNPLNRYVQLLGISLIIFSLMTLLACVRISIPELLSVNLATLATLALVIVYARLNALLALTITPLLALLCWIAGMASAPIPTPFTVWVFLITLVSGLAIYFIGYAIEGTRPSIRENAQQLFISPLMMAAEVYFVTGRQGSLKQTIYGA